jgi:hypothetical protein
MKKLYIIFSLLVYSTFITAQFTEVNIGNPSASVSTLNCLNYTGDETVVAGTYGDGLYSSSDNGTSWQDISSNIGDKMINYVYGAEGLYFVGTNGGAFIGIEGDFIDNTGTGLPNTIVKLYTIASTDHINGTSVYAIVVDGAGIYTSSEMGGPWAAANNGLSGDALYINSLKWYDGADGGAPFHVIGTNAGVYFSFDGLATWVAANNGLTGSSLIVSEAMALGGAVVIATYSGLFYSLDQGSSWITLLPDVKINKFFMSQTVSGMSFFIFGQANKYSADLMAWTDVNLGGYPFGEVFNAATNSTHIFIAGPPMKDGKSGAVLYSALLDDAVGVNENESASEASLGQNFPNPVVSNTNIQYNLKSGGYVSLRIFDLRGVEVASLVNEQRSAGSYNQSFDASTLNNGVYLYQILLNNRVIETRKMFVNH